MIINSKIGESPTLLFSEAVKRRRENNEDVISLGIGEPDLEIPAFLLNALIKSISNKDSHSYSSSNGIKKLRQKIAIDLFNRKNLNISENQILITAGAKQASQLILFSILNPGDEVIYFSPYYVSYVPQILIAEPRATLLEIPLEAGSFNIPLEYVKQKISNRTKAIIINSPHNPTGKIFDELTIRRICELAYKNNIYIIFDEVYELLNFNGIDIVSDSDYPEMRDLVFHVNSFSKSHSIPGWRIGYLTAPYKMISTLTKLQQHINTNTCSLIQEAVCSIFDYGYTFLKGYNLELKKRSELVLNTLSKLDLGISKPDAGLFFFIDISQYGLDSNTFCAQLIDKVGVALTPGVAFGELWNGYVRLSFGISDSILEEGLNRIAEFIRSLKKV